MNLVYISFYPYIDVKSKISIGGGLLIMTVNTAHKMAENGHKVLLLCPGTFNKLSNVSENLQLLEIESFPTKDIPFPLLSSVNRKFINDCLENFKPDIIHSQEISPLGLFAQKWANNLNIHFITTLHTIPSDIIEFSMNDIMYLSSDIEWPRQIKKAPAKLLYKEYFNNSNAIVALNEAIKKDLLNYTPENKIHVIPNGHNIESFYEIPVYKGKQNNIIYTGSIGRRKNQIFLIHVKSFLKKAINLFLLGPAFNEDYLKDLQKIISEENISNIHFIGSVPNSTVKDYLKKSKVFVSASKKEVQSLAVIEALAAGRPVVALENETTSELIDDAVGKLLPKTTTPKEFADEVNKILNLDADSYKKLAENCCKRVERFAWPDVIKQLEELYAEVQKNGYIKNKKAKHINLLVYSFASVLIVGVALTIRKLSVEKYKTS